MFHHKLPVKHRSIHFLPKEEGAAVQTKALPKLLTDKHVRGEAYFVSLLRQLWSFTWK